MSKRRREQQYVYLSLFITFILFGKEINPWTSIIRLGSQWKLHRQFVKLSFLKENQQLFQLKQMAKFASIQFNQHKKENKKIKKVQQTIN